MASLDRMAIRGVRSFDERSVNVIQFLTPLTVIVGTNGSGKTTIIECLKYCTTGDLPPNSKGGAFVHDPGMASANEVKAQVRLRFYNTNHVRINCARNLQVSRKKGGGLTMKTLEAILQIDDQQRAHNRRSVLSTKCAEIDEEMPSLLGVSRAILDNVIFCHQEDNNWPLGEPSALKKRFDDIFEATRYTKALDNIKSLRKERAISLKVARAEIDGLRVDRQRADSVKDKLQKLEDELKEKEDRLAKLNKEVEELTIKNTAMYDKAVRFREIVQRAESLEDKKKQHEEYIETLKTSMTELREDESELQRRKDGFQNHLQDLKRKQDDHKRRIASRKESLANLDRDHGKRLSEKGALESEQRQHERAIRQRRDVISKICSELNISGYDNVESLTQEDIEEFSDQIKADAQRLTRENETLKTENARKEEDVNTRLQDLRSATKAKEASRTNLEEEVKRLKDRIRRLQDEIDSNPSGDVDIEAAKREHSAQESHLNQLLQEQTDARHDDKIRDKNTEIRAADDRREELTAELNMLNRQADFRAKLDLTKKAATQKEGDIEAILSRQSEALVRYTGGKSSARMIESDVQKAKVKIEKDLTGAEADKKEADRQLQRLESTLTFAQGQLKDKTTLKEKIEREIKDALDGEFDSLEDGLKQCAEEIEYAKTQIALYESMSSFIRNLEVHVKDKKVCLGCNRGIGHNEMPSIEAHIVDMMQKAQPVKLQSYKDDLATWEAQLEKLVDMKPRMSLAETLRAEDIPKHLTEVEDAQTQIRSARESAEVTGRNVESLRSSLREVVSLSNAATDVSRLLSEQAQLEKDSTSIENDLRSTGSTRTGDQVQEEIDRVTDKVKQLKREVQHVHQERDALRTTITSQERNVHKTQLAVAQKLQDQERISAQQKRLDEMKAEMEENSRKIKNLDRAIETSSDPLRRLGDELATIKSEAATKQNAANANISLYNDLARDLLDATSAVDSFLKARGPQKLKACQDAIDELQEQTKEAQKEISGIQEKVDAIEKDLNESRATERNISDNLHYIRLHREMEEIDRELRGMNLEEALTARREWNEKYNESKRKENDMNGKASHLNGEISGLGAQIKAREKELRDDYKDVHKTFTQKLVEFKTSELAQNDLELYQKALHSAIMRFHSIKMEEINETLNDLWVKTYKGTDIDTIMIRADGEGVGNRTYNYRVVMVKDSIEMDMRGRCSAGQKCLASILIRLSLADSFSENCGIMALDEPTTNLDEHNILALAESLGTLIEERRKQSNFQLIVITHDVNFLSQLAHSSGGIERYFRVERDASYRSTIIQETQLP